MTTVLAVKDGKKITIVTDMQATQDNRRFTVEKSYEVGPYVFAACGSLAGLQKTRRSLKKAVKKKGHKPSVKQFLKHVDEDCEYVLALKGRLYNVGGMGDVVEYEDGEVATAGSGGAIALGAFYAGAEPHEAVSIATEHDLYSGQGIAVITVE